nr:unnamed protein product [Spirometra erinaceieuropaei]
MFSTTLTDAYRDERPGIRIAYRTNDHIPNSQRTQASPRYFMTTVHDLPFADDCMSNTETEADIQRSMHLFASDCANFGLTINTCSVYRIRVNDTQMKTVNSIAYLGDTLALH